mgnify:CR=1 FL=1
MWHYLMDYNIIIIIRQQEQKYTWYIIINIDMVNYFNILDFILIQTGLSVYIELTNVQLK